MRFWTALCVLILALALVSPTRAAWDKDDYEIFELQAALEASEGKGTTFYSMLNVTRDATSQQIKTAYRKRSVELHPDKHPSNPSAAKRFERLGLINKILRDERKDRYDYFLSTGFPKWRGTGYFYERFRPGLLSVIVGILTLTVLVEHLIKRLNFARDAKRLGQLRRAALFQAWGPRFYQVLYGGKGAPSVAPEKKLKLHLASLPELPLGPTPAQIQEGKVDWDVLEKDVRKSVLSSGASAAPLNTVGPPRIADVLVTRESDGEGIVWVLDVASGEWSEVNEDKMARPTFQDSWPIRIVRGFQQKRHLAAEEPSDATSAAASAPTPTQQKAKAKNDVSSASSAVKKGRAGNRR